MKTNGAERKTPSKRSSTPPCPGNILPESLILTFLLSIDSVKSPKVLVIAIIEAMMIHWTLLSSVRYFERINAVPTAKMAPVKNPSHDFSGDILLNNLCLP